MSSVTTLVRHCPLLRLVLPTLQGTSVSCCAASIVLASIKPASGISSRPQSRIYQHQLQYSHCLRACSFSFRLCQPFKTHRSSIVRRFSPIRF